MLLVRTLQNRIANNVNFIFGPCSSVITFL